MTPLQFFQQGPGIGPAGEEAVMLNNDARSDPAFQENQDYFSYQTGGSGVYVINTIFRQPNQGIRWGFSWDDTVRIFGVAASVMRLLISVLCSVNGQQYDRYGRRDWAEWDKYWHVQRRRLVSSAFPPLFACQHLTDLDMRNLQAPVWARFGPTGRPEILRRYVCSIMNREMNRSVRAFQVFNSFDRHRCSRKSAMPSLVASPLPCACPLPLCGCRNLEQ